MDQFYHSRKKGDLLHPERENATVLAQIRRDQTPKTFAAQYLGVPETPDGAIIHTDWFQEYDNIPERKPGDEIIQSWDTANKPGLSNDYSVCTTWLVKGDAYYLLDVLRQRLEFPELRRKAIVHADQCRAHWVLVEDAASGQQLFQEMRRTAAGAMWKLKAVRPTVDKVQRAEAQTVAIEGKQVYLPKSAPWRAEFLEEVRNFPRGSHDDQVDSMTQFLEWVRGDGNAKPIFECDF